MRVVSGKKYNIILLLVYQDLIITYILLEINLKTALKLKLINKINESRGEMSNRTESYAKAVSHTG